MPEHQLFDRTRIAESLRRFQDSFADINETLSLGREEFTDEMLGNIVAAYDFLNGLLGKNIELFSPAGLHSMLELNHIVLCGTDHVTRYHYHSHILQTRSRYLTNIRRIRTWVLARFDRIDPYVLAAEFYARSLSRPQLFIEGNHRTENIIINYILLSRDCPPYVIGPENAHEYLEISGGIKLSEQDALGERLFHKRGRKRAFAEFLSTHASADFLVSPRTAPTYSTSR